MTIEKRIRIGIIDDDEIWLSDCKDFLEKQSDTICVLASKSCQEFYRSLKPFHYLDILLLEINLQEESGLDNIPGFVKLLPNTTIIINTLDEDEQKLFKAFSRGAHGYLLKTIKWGELYEFLKITQKGGAAISPKMVRALINYFSPSFKPKWHNKLGQKDLQVLNLLAEGWTYQYIADQLGMSIDNVRYYVKKLYKRLNVNSRYEATRKFNDDPDIYNLI